MSPLPCEPTFVTYVRKFEGVITFLGIVATPRALMATHLAAAIDSDCYRCCYLCASQCVLCLLLLIDWKAAAVAVSS